MLRFTPLYFLFPLQISTNLTSQTSVAFAGMLQSPVQQGEILVRSRQLQQKRLSASQIFQEYSSLWYAEPQLFNSQIIRTSKNHLKSSRLVLVHMLNVEGYESCVYHLLQYVEMILIVLQNCIKNTIMKKQKKRVFLYIISVLPTCIGGTPPPPKIP